jgi:hypothetical protein
MDSYAWKKESVCGGDVYRYGCGGVERHYTQVVARYIHRYGCDANREARNAARYGKVVRRDQ